MNMNTNSTTNSNSNTNPGQMKAYILKESCKFLSGAFFVTAGASWYFAYYRIEVPLMGTTMSPDFLFVRGFIHMTLCALSFWYGYLRKAKDQ